jgi:hypothetical protein
LTERCENQYREQRAEQSALHGNEDKASFQG